MEFSYIPQLDKRKHADALVLPLWKGTKRAEWAVSFPEAMNAAFALPLETGDFKGKEGEVLCLYMRNQPEKRVFLLGLGSRDKATAETIRRSYGSLTKACLGRQLQSLNLLVPSVHDFSEEILVRSLTEGLLLPNYSVDKLKHPDPEEANSSTLIQKVTFISHSQDVLSIAKKTFAICEGVYYARDLVNGNADDVTPQYLEKCAQDIAKDYSKVKVTLFNKKRIEKEKMGLLLAVNRGSALDPAFIIMEYKGDPKSKDHTVLIGKGITYDTGGLNIKTMGMETMKCDMAGAAVGFGTLIAVCNLKLKVNLTVVIPATENCVDAKSFKPGDVYTSYSGKTVEMTNSDAEGRLILADALAYAVKHLHPTRLIDFATLTGGIDVALGSEATGMMCNDEQLASAFLQAGAETFERVWRMPLYEEYKEKLKSDIADTKSWNGRSATSCVAATFMQQFTGNVPWVHFDIASTAYITDAKKYQPKYATGVGIRLMIEFLEKLTQR